jgi:hypothetical protein
MSEAEDKQATTLAELEKTPQGVVRRWRAELALADEEEGPWRKTGTELFDLYRTGKKKADSFNILWSNTETMAPAVYNSTPQPDVRRRFRDADPLGKAVSEVVERSLSYCIDTQDFDDTIGDGVLDMLVPGRGLARIKYQPTFAPQAPPVAGDLSAAPSMPPEGAEPAAAAPVAGDPAAPVDPLESIIDEAALLEHVQWDDFRRGPGKRWKDVPWEAFRHRMTRDMLVESFGEDIAKLVPITTDNKPGSKAGKGGDKDKDVQMVLKTAEVWEIWDKEAREVIFLCLDYKDGPLKVVPDPLRLAEFFPTPRPMYAIRDSERLVPTPLFQQYEQQAKELERVSARINKIIGALKVRGAYQAALKEVSKILEADDLTMQPVENVSAIAQAGGLDKAIWILPVEKLIQVLTGLYTAREQVKAVIYEITGISDIARGMTDPNETASAQQLKSQWGSLRLQKMQREVQRFVRDLMRLMADLIGQHFNQQTLMQITGLQYPTAMEKQQAQQQLAMAQQQAAMVPPPMPGMPPPPPPAPPDPELMKAAQSPSWEEIIAVMRSDGARTCRIDVETDSTVAETVQRDVQGVTEAVGAIGGVIQSSIPAIQSGMLPIDAVKAICLAIARRARLGSAVESAIDQIQAPAPQGPTPEQMAQQEQAAADEKQAGADDRKGTQDAVKQLMQALEQGFAQIQATASKPRKLIGMASPDGRVEGLIEEGA